MHFAEPIRLVIWDLDETFWKGTLSEGGIERFEEANCALVISLARRGIMSSICSKNDMDAVRPILQGKGVWDYFIFPSIDWTSKGPRVAAMVEVVGLRPASILFIDDNPVNRAEVACAVPGIVVAGEDIIPELLHHQSLAGSDDVGFTRLQRYKVLEDRRRDEISAAGDSTAFLRQCRVRVTFEHDVEPHIDRVIELVNRTNQLNFTKRRLSGDLEEAREQMRAELRFFGHQAGLVRVTDRYGDHGFVGFYLKTLDESMAAGTLVHFCFSCRVLGMGVEQWVYAAIGAPWLTTVGPVVSEVHDAPAVDWINTAAEDETASADRPLRFEEVRLRGGCEISALAHYFKVAGRVACIETNFGHEFSVIKLDTAASLLNSYGADDGRSAALHRLGFPLEGTRSQFLAPTTGPTLLVLDLWGELHIPAFRHKRDGFLVHLVWPEFMGWGEGHIGGQFTGWTDEALAARVAESGMSPEAGKRLFAMVEELRRDYDFEGQVGEERVKASLREIAASIPQGAQLALVLPSSRSSDGTINVRNHAYSSWCRDALSGRDDVVLVDIDQAIREPAERSALYGDHFDRIVYYRVAEEIMRLASPAMPEYAAA